MKRRVIKIFLAIFVFAGILVGLFVILAVDTGPEMAFRFLEGRTLRARIEEDPGERFYKTTREVYSFEADFNDVCAQADAELSAIGFKIMPLASRGISDREYRLGDHALANKWTILRIHKDIDMKVRANSNSSKFEFRWDRPRQGWVSVEILRSRLRSWPPKNFLIRLQLMWHRAKNPSLQNMRTTSVESPPSSK